MARPDCSSAAAYRAISLAIPIAMWTAFQIGPATLSPGFLGAVMRAPAIGLIAGTRRNPQKRISIFHPKRRKGDCACQAACLNSLFLLFCSSISEDRISVSNVMACLFANGAGLLSVFMISKTSVNRNPPFGSNPPWRSGTSYFCVNERIAFRLEIVFSLSSGDFRKSECTPSGCFCPNT